MKHAVASLAMLFAVALMAGCATQEGPATTRPDESLVNTYWKLTVLDGESPDVVDGQREPHFVLHADPARVMGSTGCNRMMGNYRLEASTLRFMALSSTRMACPHGASTERRFLAALNATTAWRIEGERLWLLDAQHETLARFEAVHLQ